MTTVSLISEYLNKDYSGANISLTEVKSIGNIKNNTLSFINKKSYKFNQSVEALIIAVEGYEVEKNSKCSFIFSKNPRLDFVKIVNKFFTNKNQGKISDTAKIGLGCKISENVTIGEYTVIKDNVTIGSGTIINNHVVIESNTIIGDNCYIKSGAIIGEDGFGFERDEDGVPLRFPHIGNVIIGNNVEIGANTIIARATLDSTIIQDNVKIDDKVIVAHNVTIGSKNIICGCTNFGGSVKVGNNNWFGPKSSIIDGISIGNNNTIGIGALIKANIKDDSVYSELATMDINKASRYRVVISKLLKKN